MCIKSNTTTTVIESEAIELSVMGDVIYISMFNMVTAGSLSLSDYSKVANVTKEVSL